MLWYSSSYSFMACHSLHYLDWCTFDVVYRLPMLVWRLSLLFPGVQPFPWGVAEGYNCIWGNHKLTIELTSTIYTLWNHDVATTAIFSTSFNYVAALHLKFREINGRLWSNNFIDQSNSSILLCTLYRKW